MLSFISTPHFLISGQNAPSTIRRSSFTASVNVKHRYDTPSKVFVFHQTCPLSMTAARDNQSQIPNIASPADLHSVLNQLSERSAISPETIKRQQEQQDSENNNVPDQLSKHLRGIEKQRGYPSSTSSSNQSESQASQDDAFMNEILSDIPSISPNDFVDNDADDYSELFPSWGENEQLEKQEQEKIMNDPNVQIHDNIYDDGDINTKQEEEISEQKSRRFQSDPRKTDTNKLKLAKQNIQRRRNQLATERGEDDLNNINNKRTEEISQLEKQVLNDSKRTYIVDSVQDSLPFCFNTATRSKQKQNELVALLSKYSQMYSTFPWSYRPFFALTEAFDNLQYDACPRCSKLQHYQVFRDNSGVCKDCYSQIFLSGPPIPQIVRLIDDPTISTSSNNSFVNQKNENNLVQQAQNIVNNLSNEKEITNDIDSHGYDSNPIRDLDPAYSKNVFISEKQKKTNQTRMEASNESSSTTSTSKPLGRQSDIKGSENRNGKENDNNGNDNGNGNGKDDVLDVDRDEDEWNVIASERAKRTINPIRNLVQNITVKPNPNKKLMKLSVGDPTVYGNLRVSDKIIDEFVKELRKGTANGYSHSTGVEKAREAVAKRYSGENSKLTSEDVILTSGASGALELVIGSIANEGDNILLPQPGFPLFQTLAENYGIECRYYRLKPHDGWKVDLTDINDLVDFRTRAIIVNNPSNPCGSVFSRSHMESILSVASALRLPVISDEVYADMVYGTTQFHSFGNMSIDVPVLCVGAVSKQFIVPGWRLGWVLVHDRDNIFKNAGLIDAMKQLTTRMIVPNTPAQMVLPKMFEDNEGFETVMNVLEENAQFTMDRLQSIKGLKCIKPSGAMYVMVLIDAKKLGLKDDMEFVEKLLQEESVFALPGQCFQAPNFFRVVYAAPKDVLEEAFSRIEAFCNRRIK